jgi:hypothetical protein
VFEGAKQPVLCCCPAVTGCGRPRLCSRGSQCFAAGSSALAKPLPPGVRCYVRCYWLGLSRLAYGSGGMLASGRDVNRGSAEYEGGVQTGGT